MAIEKNPNPLLSVQREKAGSQTYEKYGYQYHWALYRVLEKHEKRMEYAVFVELHEDVVVADSLNSDKAKFEFNQVKTTNKKFNTKGLTELKNGKSILGKLLSNSLGKPYSSKLTLINLVSLKAFNLELKTKGLNLEAITLSDLSVKQHKELEDAIKKQISRPLPAILQFTTPTLSEKNFQNDIIAIISKLITTLFPGSNYNSVDIYRVLIDDLNKKGVVSYDFTKWEDLLSRKALTSTKVTEVINAFTNIKDEAKIEVSFNAILTELDLNSIQGTKLRRSFNRYRQTRISNNSTLQIDTTNEIVKLIHEIITGGEENIKILIASIADKLSQKIKQQFADENHVKGAIICEYIMNI